jgi:hypothetical protein
MLNIVPENLIEYSLNFMMSIILILIDFKIKLIERIISCFKFFINI